MWGTPLAVRVMVAAYLAPAGFVTTTIAPPAAVGRSLVHAGKNIVSAATAARQTVGAGLGNDGRNVERRRIPTRGVSRSSDATRVDSGENRVEIVGEHGVEPIWR